MPTYMIQGAYGTEGLAAIVKNPQNRIQAVKPAIENLGGKLKDAYFSFGDYDFVIIADMPDNVSAVALSLAFGAGGCAQIYKDNASSECHRNNGSNEEGIWSRIQ